VRILIADDQPLDRSVLRLALEKWGYTVVEAGDGNEAVARLSGADAPSIAVLDWMMPGMSGPEICEHVRYQENERYTYILLLTSKDAKEDLLKGLSSGADDYVVKPVDMHELQVRLRAARRIIELQEELIATREELRIQATRDFLTGVWNRGMIMRKVHEEIDRASRRSEPIGVVMVDIDHFKQINDTHGHPAGDAVLVEVSRRMQDGIRSYDALGRFGGEEFLIVCPTTDATGVVQLGERLRDVVSSKPIEANGQSIRVTVSIGVTAHDCSKSCEIDRFISEADAALYAAKRNGRDRVEVSSNAVIV
jgi:diguanylate cyclase (GGDEF)-like protein